MKIEFDIFNRELFRTLTFSLKFQRTAQVSIIYMKNIVFLLPSGTTGTRSVWKSIQAKANTMVLDNKLFFNGFHSFENIFLLRNNFNVLKFKGNH
jgi:hypothetical protein